MVLDPELNVLFSLEGNFWNGESALLSDGRMAVLRRNNEGSLTLTAVDLETKDWGDDYPMPAMNNSVYDGAGEYLFHYNNGESLYGYDPETGEGVRLLRDRKSVV